MLKRGTKDNKTNGFQYLILSAEYSGLQLVTGKAIRDVSGKQVTHEKVLDGGGDGGCADCVGNSHPPPEWIGQRREGEWSWEVVALMECTLQPMLSIPLNQEKCFLEKARSTL